MEILYHIAAYEMPVRLVCQECAYVLQDIEDGIVIELNIHFPCEGILDARQFYVKGS